MSSRQRLPHFPAGPPLLAELKQLKVINLRPLVDKHFYFLGQVLCRVAAATVGHYQQPLLLGHQFVRRLHRPIGYAAIGQAPYSLGTKRQNEEFA